MWKIQFIQITGFRGIEAFTDRISAGSAILLGANASGKTRTLQALRMALLGECHGVDGKRLRMADMVAAGDTGQIKLVIDDGGTNDQGKPESLTLISTVAEGKFTFDYHRGTRRAYNRKGQAIRIAFAEQHQTTEDAMCIALDPYRYLVDPDALAEILAKLANDAGDVATPLREFCGDWFAGIEAIAGEMGHDLTTMGGIDDLGTDVFARRTDAKRHAAQLSAQLEGGSLKFLLPPRDRHGNEMTPEHLGAIKDLIPVIQKQLEDGAAEIASLTLEGRPPDVGAMKGRIAALRDALGRDEKERANAAKRAKTAKRELEKLKPGDEDDQVDMIDDLPDLRRASGSLQVERNEKQSLLDTYEAALKAGTGPCPCNGACIKCDGLIEIDDYTRESMNEDAGALVLLIAEVGAAITRAEGLISEAEAKLPDAERRKAIRDAREKLEALRKAVATLDGKIESKNEEIATLEADLAEAQSTESTDHTHEIEALEAKQATNRTRLETALTAHETLIDMKRRDDLKAELATVASEIEFLDWGVDSFQKRQFQKTQMGDGRANFEATCNEVLGRFNRTLRIDLEGTKPTVEICTIAPDNQAQVFEFFPIMQCSNGERVMVAMAVGAAYANGGPVFVDNINDLDGEFKDKAILGAKALLDKCTFILAATWSDGPKPSDRKWDRLHKAIAPMLPIWIENGRFQSA